MTEVIYEKGYEWVKENKPIKLSFYHKIINYMISIYYPYIWLESAGYVRKRAVKILDTKTGKIKTIHIK